VIPRHVLIVPAAPGSAPTVEYAASMSNALAAMLAVNFVFALAINLKFKSFMIRERVQE
jgi:hypothetical protein